MLQEWLLDLKGVIAQPNRAVFLFIMGYALVLVATKQVDEVLNFLELVGLPVPIHQSPFKHLVPPSVCLMVWLDLCLFNEVANWMKVVKRLFTRA